MSKLKTVRVPRGYEGLHCEVDGCIVNIRVNLHDLHGRPITNIEVIADQAGERWEILDQDVAKATGVRVGKVEYNPDPVDADYRKAVR